MSRAEPRTEGSSYGRPFQTALTVRPSSPHSSYFAPSTFKWNESASACTKLHLTRVTPSVFLFSSPITSKCWAVCVTLWEGPDRAHFQSEPFCMVTFRARLGRIIEHADALLHCLYPNPVSSSFTLAFDLAITRWMLHHRRPSLDFRHLLSDADGEPARNKSPETRWLREVK